MLTRASKTNDNDHKTVTRSYWIWLNWIGNVPFESGNTEAVVQNETSECFDGCSIAIATKLESHITVHTRAEIQRRRILTGLSCIHSQIFLFFCLFFFYFRSIDYECRMMSSMPAIRSSSSHRRHSPHCFALSVWSRRIAVKDCNRKFFLD